ALALCAALLLARRTEGEKLASPTHVRFDAEIGHHLLRWQPGHSPRGDIHYQVELGVYGTNFSWTSIPSCTKILEHSCDLTYYTLDPAQRYYARVRAVSGNHTSPWQRTNAFSMQEAHLRLPGQSLSVTGNTIHVQLQLLFRVGNLSVKYDSIHKHLRQYRVYVRRTQNNRTYEVMKNVPEFNITNLFWDTEYCVSVEPVVSSRPSRATRTAEQCVTTAERDRSAELVLSMVGSSFISRLLLGLLGILLVCTYIKKPMRPPSVLKSFIKQSSLWVEQEPSSSGIPDGDRVQQLFLCQKEPRQDGSPDMAQLPPEKGWGLPAGPEDRLRLLGLGADSSSTSTDSGICLRASFSSELSGSSGHEPRGYKQQLPTGDDSGVGLDTPCPMCSGHPHGEELGFSPATSQESQQDVEFRGYLQQSKGTVEPRQDLAEGVPSLGCAGSPQGMGSADIVLVMECSELAVAKGYLKQYSSQHPRSHAQDLAPWKAPWNPTAWDFSSQVGLQAPTLLSYGAPGAPLACKASPELLKAPLDLSIFNTDLLGTLPLTSSLSTNEWLGLE
ncbi:Interleukin-10 receptor subunit alpha, partial [Mesitornis unicolor]